MLILLTDFHTLFYVSCENLVVYLYSLVDSLFFSHVSFTINFFATSVGGNSMVIILGITKLHATIILRYVVYTPGQSPSDT